MDIFESNGIIRCQGCGQEVKLAVYYPELLGATPEGALCKRCYDNQNNRLADAANS